jgi:hypothetical protein
MDKVRETRCCLLVAGLSPYDVGALSHLSSWSYFWPPWSSGERSKLPFGTAHEGLEYFNVISFLLRYDIMQTERKFDLLYGETSSADLTFEGADVAIPIVHCTPLMAET